MNSRTPKSLLALLAAAGVGLLALLLAPADPSPSARPEAPPPSPSTLAAPAPVTQAPVAPAARSALSPVARAEAPVAQDPAERLRQLRALLAARLPARPLGAEVDDDTRMLERYAHEPVGSLFPSLGEEPAQRQLETLRWMRHLPPERIVSAMPGLQAAFPLEWQERNAMAREMVELLVEQLERQGHRVEPLPEGLAVASFVESPPPVGPLDQAPTP